MADKITSLQVDATALVKRVITNIYGQQVSEQTINAVSKRVAKSVEPAIRYNQKAKHSKKSAHL